MGEPAGSGTGARRYATRQRWRPSVALALFVAFGALVFVATTASFLVAAVVAERNTSELVTDTAELYLENMKLRIESILGPARRQVEFVADYLERPGTDLGDDQRIGDILLGALAPGADIAGLAFVRPNLQTVYAGLWENGQESGSENFVTWPEMRLILRTAEGTGDETVWTDPIYLDLFKSSFITVMHPVRNDDGFQGVAVAAVSLTSLSQAVRFDAAEQPGLVPFVLRDGEHVIAHPSIADSLVQFSEEVPVPTRRLVHDNVLANLWEAERDPIVLIDASDIEALELELGYEDQIAIMAEIADYGETPYTIGLHFPRGQAGGYADRLVLAIYVGIAIVLLSILIAWLLGRAVGRPVKRLASNASLIAALDFGSARPLPSSPFRETDEARVAFNSMLRGLRWFETYIPRRLVERLIEQGGEEALPSEYRDVTVLFTDIVGFTSIGERLSAQKLSAFLNRHFTVLAEHIEREGGTIDKYIGDSIMAFWNAPDPQPDHADRAVRAALAIARALHEDNERRARKGLRPVRLRIGLHTGPAVAGNIGAPGRVNYTLVGDTVNTAQRLESLGKEMQPDVEVSIIASETVIAAVQHPVPHRSLGSTVLRGHSEPLKVFRIDTE